MNIDTFFSKYKEYADFPIRLLVGTHLIIGTQDNVFSWERMLEFESFLSANGLPMPLVGAIVSVYAQFICGILFILGWKLRWAASIMIFNFLVAFILVHLDDTWRGVFPALTMFIGSIFLLMNGGGRWSIDGKMK